MAAIIPSAECHVVIGNDALYELNLFVERNGKREQLFPEAGEVFFRKGVEGKILFRCDTSGKVVDALIDRRNNEDVVWRRVK